LSYKESRILAAVVWGLINTIAEYVLGELVKGLVKDKAGSLKKGSYAVNPPKVSAIETVTNKGAVDGETGARTVTLAYPDTMVSLSPGVTPKTDS